MKKKMTKDGPGWDPIRLTQEEWKTVAKALLAFPATKRGYVSDRLRQVASDFLRAKGEHANQAG